MRSRKPSLPGRSRRAAAALVALAISSVPGVLSADGNLQGRQLLAVDEPRSDALSSLLRWTGSSPGTLESVSVREERPGSVAVRIAHSGFDGKQVWGVVLDEHKRAQKAIRGTSTIFPAGGTAVELSFEVHPALPAGRRLDSAYLRLNVGRPGSRADFTRLFRFPKSWQVEPRPEGVVVRVIPRPLGAAARLGEHAPGGVLPPAKVLTRTGSYVRRAPLPADPPTPKPVRRLTLGGAAPTTSNRSVTQLQTANRLLDLRRVAASPAIRALPAGSHKLLDPSRFEFGVRPDDRERGAAGPGPDSFELLGTVRAEEEVDLRRADILNVFPIVYRDQNENSGCFYFLPAAYRLAWDADAGSAKGLGLRMLYDAAAAGQDAGNVHLALRLDAGVDAADVSLARELLQAYARAHGLRFTELRPMPIASPPEIAFAGDLQHQYDIPVERVTVHAMSDALGAIELSVATDAVTKENLQLALLEDVGLNGRVVFEPAGGALAAQEIPMRIRLADRETYGRLGWTPGSSRRNRTPYPMRLEYLHALLLQNGEPVVYSWSLGATVVPPGATVELDSSPLPAWLDAQAKRVWLDYALDADCEPCDESVIAEITGGVSRLLAREITLHTLAPLADTGAHQISVVVRSRYFHPRSREVQQGPAFVVKEDDRSYGIGSLFLAGRRPGASVPGDPLLEYSLKVVMPDGTVHRSRNWLPSDDLEIVLGTKQVRDSLGFLPGTDDDD